MADEVDDGDDAEFEVCKLENAVEKANDPCPHPYAPCEKRDIFAVRFGLPQLYDLRRVADDGNDGDARI